MADDLRTVEIESRRAWRAWLQKNHKTSPGVWLVCFKKHTGVPGPTYEETVGEALCFGWIDSLGRRLDDDRYLRKITPRRSGSIWSDNNRRLYAQMKAQGLLAPAGEKAAPTGKKYAPPPSIPAELPDYIARAFKADPKAWKFFNQLAPGERRKFVSWIHTAKRPETREKRIRESIALLAEKMKLGLK